MARTQPEENAMLLSESSAPGFPPMNATGPVPIAAPLLGTLIAASAALTTASTYEEAEAPYFAARRAFYDAEDGDGVTDTERAAWACVMDNMATVLDALRGPVTPLVVMVGAR